MGESFFGLCRWMQTNKNFLGLVFKRRAGRGVTQPRLPLGECWCQFQRSNARLSGVGGRTQAGEGWRALSTAQRKEAVRLALEKEREKARLMGRVLLAEDYGIKDTKLGDEEEKTLVEATVRDMIGMHAGKRFFTEAREAPSPSSRSPHILQ